MIAITEISGKLDTKQSIEKQLRKAMELAMNHWMVINEDDRFKSAIGAVIINADEETKEIISNELKGLRGLNALYNGLPIDIVRLAKQAEGKKVYGLNKIWLDVKKANA